MSTEEDEEKLQPSIHSDNEGVTPLHVGVRNPGDNQSPPDEDASRSDRDPTLQSLQENPL